MKLAHLRGLLAALLAASFAVAADVKISPLDGVHRGFAASDYHPPSASHAEVRAFAQLVSEPPSGDLRGGPARAATMYPRLKGEPKSTANGLTMSGGWNAAWVGSTVALTLDDISNDSFTRTTGTLRLELWAVSSPPARGAGFTGYRLAVFANLDPLPPRYYYSDVVRSATMTYPPDGTYWMVLVLSEYDSVNCGQDDYFCITDSLISGSTSTFGNATPPPPPPPSSTLGVSTTSAGARGTVSGSAPMYGGFSVASSARVYILVRGNSLGSLGVTNAYMDAPRVRLYNAAGTDLVSQNGMAGFNFCASSNVTTDLPVIQLYQGRGQPVSSRDGCYTTVLGAGTYTFSVTPSTFANSASTTSSTGVGEVLFEVTLLSP